MFKSTLRAVFLLVATLMLSALSFAQYNPPGKSADARNKCDDFYENLRLRVKQGPNLPPRAQGPNSALRATRALRPSRALGLIGAAESSSYPELSEGNAASWSAFAEDGRATTVSNDSTMVKAGTQSIKFTTQSGFGTGVRFPGTGQAEAHWDLTTATHLSFWAYSVNTNQYGFQGNQPVITLRCSGGSLRYVPSTQGMANNAWSFFSIPLTGSSQWVRSASGAPLLSDVLQLEIWQDTWDYGFTVYYDSVNFVGTSDNTSWPTPPPPAGLNANAIKPRVLLYCFDPIMENKGGLRQHDAYSDFRDPVGLASQVASTLSTDSHGMAQYQIVDTKVVDAHPYFADGFQHTDATFDSAWRARDFHNATFDYARFVRENNIVARIESGDLDEVWIYAGPINGMYESAMAGDGAYWINGIAPGIASKRAFVMMGWNFERRVGEAIHSFGHRAESIMAHSYGAWQSSQSNSWNKFALQERQLAGQGGVGNVHFPVNGVADYDYANTRYVQSNADDWRTYPNATAPTRTFSCTEWTPSFFDPQKEYLDWWYHHMPAVAGMAGDGFLSNWWRYLADVDQFKGWNGNVGGTRNAPAAAIVSPAPGAQVSGVVNVRAEAQVEGAMGRVDFYMDGVYQSTDTMSPYTLAWNTAGLQGSHRIDAKAYELRYGREAVATVLVNIGQKLRLSASTSVVSENAAQGPVAATITVTREGDASQPVSVNYATSEGTARAGIDYTSTSGTLNLAAGESSKSFLIPITDDALDEDDETINVTLSQAVGATLGAPSTATLTIADDDLAPRLSIAPATIVEGRSGNVQALFPVKLSSASGREIKVDYLTSDGSAPAATEGSDYTRQSGTLTIAAGETGGTISVAVVGDARHEADEKFVVTLSNPVNASLLAADSTGLGTIADDDPVGFSIAPVAGTPASGLATSEAGATAAFTIKLTSQPTADVTLGLSSSNAQEGVASPSTCTFTSTNWEAPQTITATGVDDAIADGAQSYKILTQAPTSQDADYGALRAEDVADVALSNADDDRAGITLAAAAGLTTTEGGGTAVFTLKLDSQPTADVTIGLSSSNPSEGAVAPSTCTFTSSNWNVAQTVTISGANDALVDGPQSYSIVTSAAQSTDANYNGREIEDVAVTNSDDDAGTLGLSLSASSVVENAGANALTGTLTRNFRLAEVVTVALSSTLADATVPAQVTFAAGVSSVTFAIGVVDNTVAEGSRTTTLTAAAGDIRASQALTILDNEPAILGLSLAASSAAEDSTQRIRGTLTRNPSGGEVSVALFSSDTSEARVPALVTIPAGASSATFAVSLVDDLMADGSQAVTIRAQAAGFAAPASATLVVTDNEKPSLFLSLSPARVSENNGLSTATLRRNTEISAATPSLSVTLSASVSNQASLPRTVTIPAGAASVSFEVRGSDNKQADGPRLITVTASAKGLLSGTADVVITDNEAASSSSISGQVLVLASMGSQPVPNTTIALRRGTTLVDRMLTGTDGRYDLSGLPTGTYTVTPTKPDYTFAPTSRTVTIGSVGTATRGIDFVGTPRPQINGSLFRLDADGSSIGLANVEVVALNASGSFSARTNIAGAYVLDALPLGDYSVAPVQAGTAFSPSTRSVSLTPGQPSAEAMDFTVAGSDATASARALRQR